MAPTPNEAGADPKRTRRRYGAHANFRQYPPIAVLSLFKRSEQRPLIRKHRRPAAGAGDLEPLRRRRSRIFQARPSQTKEKSLDFLGFIRLDCTPLVRQLN